MPITLTQRHQALETALERLPEEQARDCGFIRRQRKLTASAFVKAMVFGHLADPHAGVGELARLAACPGVEITP